MLFYITGILSRTQFNGKPSGEYANYSNSNLISICWES